ncbi:MAG: O-antigen ligase family protein [Gammaproteobacteria bacterium]
MENTLTFSNYWQNYCEKFAGFTIILAAFFLSFSTSLMIMFFLLSIASYWLAGSYHHKIKYVIHHPLTYWSLGFLALFLLGTTYSSATWGESFYTLKQYLRLFLLPMLLPLFLTESNSNRALNAFLIGAAIMVALSYLKILGYFSYFHQPNPNSAFLDHINTSLIVAISIFILIYKLTEVKQRANKLFVLSLIGFEVTYLFLFNTGRSGLVLLFILFSIFLYQKLTKGKFLLGMLIFILSMLGVFTISKNFSDIIKLAHEHTAAYITHKELKMPTSEGERLTFWKNSIRLFEKHPMFGTGTGSFEIEYSKIAGNSLKTDNPHNQYLYFAVQFGILGVIILIAWFFYLLYISRYIPNNLRYIIQGVIISFIIGCFFNSWLKDAVPGQLFMFFLAMGFTRLKGSNSYDYN